MKKEMKDLSHPGLLLKKRSQSVVLPKPREISEEKAISVLNHYDLCQNKKRVQLEFGLYPRQL
jgi:hypothetical protein